jgi:hypothetical protein
MRALHGLPAIWRQPGNLLGRGQRAFERARFDEAQTLWETEALLASGETRDAILGLASIAAGMIALEEQRPRAAARLLARGRRALRGRHLEGVDVAAICAAADVFIFSA